MDLGRDMSEMKMDGPTTPKKGKSYPTLFASGVKGAEGVSAGDDVTIKGKVKRVTATEEDDGTMTYSCDIECQSMDCESCEGEDGLDSAMKKMEKKKMASMSESDEEASEGETEEE